MNISELSSFGGILAILVLIHFIADWIFQSHSTALTKHIDENVRVIHCFIYSTIFLPIFLLLNLHDWEGFLAFNILFWSHFYLDTYKPVFLWVKYIRKPPEMIEYGDKGFAKFVATPLGLILAIVVDQIFHISCLIPVAYLAIN